MLSYLKIIAEAIVRVVPVMLLIATFMPILILAFAAVYDFALASLASVAPPWLIGLVYVSSIMPIYSLIRDLL